MEVSTAAMRRVSLAQSPSRKQWRAVSEHSIRNAAAEELERSKLGQSDERTIYEVQQGQELVHVDGTMGRDDVILLQRIHDLARQRVEMHQMEIELRAQMIAKSEIVDMQNSFDVQLKEQANVVARLQEQLGEREQSMRELETKMEEKERELHAVKLDNKAAWANEDLLREQNKELASLRRERDNIDAERAHHRQQMHDLQEHIQEKEQQLIELQDQHRVAEETLIYKDEQIRDAQAWVTRMQELDNTLQAELRERTEQYNQLWLGCQRQFAEIERMYMQTIQQLRLELAGTRGKSGTDSAESQNNTIDNPLIGPTSGNRIETNGSVTTQNGSESLPDGYAEHSQPFVSSGSAPTQPNHAASLPLTPSLLGIPPYLAPGQVTTMHPYIMHQQGTNHSVVSQVPQSHVAQYQSVPTMTSTQHWQNQQAVSEGPPMSSQNQYSLSQAEQNPSRPESSYSYEFSVNGQTLHPDHLNVHIGQGIDPISQSSSIEAVQSHKTMEKCYFIGADAQHSLHQISSQFQEALRLEHFNQTGETKVDENGGSNIYITEPDSQDVGAERPSTLAGPSDTEPVNPAHFPEATVNNTVDAVLLESCVSSEQTNGSLTGKIPKSDLDERALLAYIVRTIPSGGKIRISSTLPNRLGKMLAPLHWHDYKRKYGKLDDFVRSHPDLFLIEGDYIQLREGAQGIIAATAAVAKVAAAAAASSPYSSSFPPVAVTPMAVHTGRGKKLSTSEQPTLVKPPADSTHHSHGSAYSSGSPSNLNTLSKSKDPLELNGPEMRSGHIHPQLNATENGAYSDRSILANPQNQIPIHATSDSFITKQRGRTTAASLTSRR